MPAFLLALLLVLSGFGLDKPDAAPIALGETVWVDDDLALTFLAIEDSRCPRNVECVWEGQLTVRVRITEGDEVTETSLAVQSAGTPAYVTSDGWVLTHADLAPRPPYPEANRPQLGGRYWIRPVFEPSE